MARFLAYNTEDALSGNTVLAASQIMAIGPLRSDLAQSITGSVFSDQSGTLLVQQSFDAFNPYDPNATLSTSLTAGSPITAIPITPLSAALPSGSYVIISGGAAGAPLNSQVQTFVTSGATAAAATSIAVTSQKPAFSFADGSSVTTMNWDTVTTVAVVGGTAQGFSVTTLAPYTQLYYTNGSTLQTVFRLFLRAYSINGR